MHLQYNMEEKKRTKKFIWQEPDRYVKIKRNWWKPRGTDNRVRRRFKGQILMPNISYRSNKKTKHMLPSGFRQFLVHNVKGLEVLLMSTLCLVSKLCEQFGPECDQNEIEGAGETSIIVAKSFHAGVEERGQSPCSLSPEAQVKHLARSTRTG
ncbi:large ribosomal subunit protein eL32-like [Castor canadensis]|uniref:Large ribosomal subunit protein eL32-like n=1 Tax=Castor canadensis TaxID=51338 RepID=A0AC58KJQ9_CASCN